MLGWSRAARACRSLRKRRRILSFFGPWLQHFDGYTFAILVIRTLGQINYRHAALPNLADDAVRPNPFSAIARDCANNRSAAGQSSRKVAAPSKLDSSDSSSASRESSPEQA